MKYKVEMGWSLNYQTSMEFSILEDFFVINGKSLYLATEFESKCKLVLFYFSLAYQYEMTGEALASLNLVKNLKACVLSNTINKIKAFNGVDVEDIKRIDRAREARNFIVHESTLIGPLGTSKSSIKAIEEKIKRLRDEISHLVVGDNIVSRWLYEISEKEPTPREFCFLYQNLVQKWVFKEKL